MTRSRDRYLILNNILNRVLIPEGWLTQRLLRQPADVLYAPAGQFPLSLAPYRGVILTGSESTVHDARPWFAPEGDIVRECLAQDIPLLGICFGAQFLSAIAWGPETVTRLPIPEVGWIRVRCDGANPLFAHLPPDIVSWSGHRWGFTPRTPSLARSAHWEHQAFQIPGARAWGVQFHPEVSWLFGTAFMQREKLAQPALPLRYEGRRIPAHCRQIMHNFHQLAR